MAHLILYRSLRSYKYQTQCDFMIGTPITGYAIKQEFYELSEKGVLTIRSGYSWNGTSGGVRDTPKNMAAALIHDVFYQAMRERKLPLTERRACDVLFGKHCRALGTGRLRAKVYVWALTRFAESYATRPQSQIAPELRMPAP